MRSLGKEQKQLYVQLDELKWKIHEISPKKVLQKQRFEFQRQTLKERINAYNDQLSPLMSEWYNRQEMLHESSILLEELSNNKAKQLTLVGTQQLAIDDFKVVAQKTTEFGLVRGTIEQARIVTRQGYPLPDEPSRMLREFMNILLTEHSPQNLLLRISDELYATHGASVLAGWMYDEFGDKTIQECIDQRQPLPLTQIQNKKLQHFAKRLIANYQDKKDPGSILISEPEPKKVRK